MPTTTTFEGRDRDRSMPITFSEEQSHGSTTFQLAALHSTPSFIFHASAKTAGALLHASGTEEGRDRRIIAGIPAQMASTEREARKKKSALTSERSNRKRAESPAELLCCRAEKGSLRAHHC